MENAKKTNPANEVADERVKRTGGGGSSCSFWIFGDDESADNDLKDTFEVIDDETKD